MVIYRLDVQGIALPSKLFYSVLTILLRYYPGIVTENYLLPLHGPVGSICKFRSLVVYRVY
jgi:hypothetical protein